MKTILIVRLIAALVLAQLSIGCSAQTNPARLVDAQDKVVTHLVGKLNNPSTSPSDIKALTGALVDLQGAETKAYSLLNEREEAPQTTTRAAMNRALGEAKNLGVASSTRVNLMKDWQAARTPTAAAAVVEELEKTAEQQTVAVGKTGWFKRTFWNTSYANYRAPVTVVDTDARLAALEKKVAGK